MDYIQEDVDSMHKELEMWRTENREHSIALKREQRYRTWCTPISEIIVSAKVTFKFPKAA